MSGVGVVQMAGLPVNQAVVSAQGVATRRYRLSSRISGIIFWGAVLTGILVVAVFIKQSEDDFAIRLEYRSMMLLHAVEQALGPKPGEEVLEKGQARLRQAVSPFQAADNLAGAEIRLGGQHLLIGAIPKDPLVKSVSSNFLTDPASGERMVVTAYFDGAATNIDTVRKNLIIFLGAISFAFGLIINRILKVMLTNPIDHMIATAAAYAKGDKSVRFNDTKDDEFGFLSKFVNMALDASESMQHQLESSVQEQRVAKERAEQALRELERAQDRLIQSEKLASLGQLTAGIAHEIKNPLNFINNFSETSIELLSELKEAVTPGLEAFDAEGKQEVEELLDDLSADLATIAKHGTRADSIVKNMLMHARSTGGEFTPTDINALVSEALGLAYHGERAADSGFQIKMDTDLADGLPPLTLVPQDITRVLINLFSNAFYATRKRAGDGANPAYEPGLMVATRAGGDGVEVRIRDNGTGISADDLQGLFTPFFTTKPTGQGTGLGLSISHDIVVKQHGGRIDVDSRPGEFTEFVIWLPEQQHARQTEAGT